MLDRFHSQQNTYVAAAAEAHAKPSALRLENEEPTLPSSHIQLVLQDIAEHEGLAIFQVGPCVNQELF